MCVICYKPMGVQFPSKTKIKTMFKNNPNGAGFMYSDGKNVYIKKGFMTLGEFNAELNKVKAHIEYPFVLHFRITTNGGTSKGLTHPFPLSADVKELTAVKATTNVGIAHNGIIPMTDYAQKGVSDTAEFIRRYMTKLIRSETDIDGDILDIIEECINSKMAILTASSDVHLIGKFVQDGNGVYYSNTSYQKKKQKTATTATKLYQYPTNDTYDYWSAYPTYVPDCDGHCRYCKYELDCIGEWSSINPYAPSNYDAVFADEEETIAY